MQYVRTCINFASLQAHASKHLRSSHIYIGTLMGCIHDQGRGSFSRGEGFI